MICRFCIKADWEGESADGGRSGGGEDGRWEIFEEGPRTKLQYPAKLEDRIGGNRKSGNGNGESADGADFRRWGGNEGDHVRNPVKTGIERWESADGADGGGWDVCFFSSPRRRWARKFLPSSAHFRMGPRSPPLPRPSGPVWDRVEPIPTDCWFKVRARCGSSGPGCWWAGRCRGRCWW